MTEELRQKAKEWVKENACDWCVNADECEQGCIDCHGISGYIAGATEAIKELQEENAELKRIVRMVAMINKDIYTEEGIKAIYAEAKQFLSEVEK